MNSYQEITKKVIDYIEKNIENEIDLDKIADNTGYSKYHLNRIFTEETGSTIYKYLQTRRLTIAAEKLVDSNRPITQIAFEAGYHSQQAFTLAFKQVYQQAPGTYRTMGIFAPKQSKLTMKASSRSAHRYYSLSLRRIEVAAA